MNRRVLVISVLGALILTVLHWLSGLILEFPQGNTINFLGILSNFLITTLLGYYIVNSRLSLSRCIAAVFVIYFIVGHFNLLIEAYIFNITNRSESMNEILRGLLLAILFCPLYVLLLKNYGKIGANPLLQFKSRSILGWLWRIILANFLYLIFYLGAGLILSISSPAIMKFYEGKIPPLDLVIKTQLYFRGF